MTSRWVFRTSLAFVFLCSTPVMCPADEPAQALSEQDIVYSKVGTDELKLDIARPAAKEGVFPAVFVIHGGAWRGEQGRRPPDHGRIHQARLRCGLSAISVLPQECISRAGSRCQGGGAIHQDQCQEIPGRPGPDRGNRFLGRRPSGAHARRDRPERQSRRGRTLRCARQPGQGGRELLRTNRSGGAATFRPSRSRSSKTFWADRPKTSPSKPRRRHRSRLSRRTTPRC